MLCNSFNCLQQFVIFQCRSICEIILKRSDCSNQNYGWIIIGYQFWKKNNHGMSLTLMRNRWASTHRSFTMRTRWRIREYNLDVGFASQKVWSRTIVSNVFGEWQVPLCTLNTSFVDFVKECASSSGYNILHIFNISTSLYFASGSHKSLPRCGHPSCLAIVNQCQIPTASRNIVL